MKKPNVIIIHGAYGYPDENWFPWLKRSLLARSIDCLVPQFPTPDNQSLKNWLTVFEKTCSDIVNEKTIMIGHSLGAAFILRLLETRQYHVHSTLLAGAFTGSVGIAKFDTINQDFFADSFDWMAIKDACQNFTCYHGDNDPYVTRSNIDSIVDRLSAKQVVISDGGHLNAAAGYTAFPLLLSHVLNIINGNYHD